MVYDIKEFQIKQGVIITVFKSDRRDFTLSKSGSVLFNRSYLVNEFSNLRMSFNNHQLLGYLKSDKTESKLDKFFKEIKYDHTFESNSLALIEYLESQGYSNDKDIFLIVPKSWKNHTGTKFENTFKVIDKNFSEYEDVLLDVWMSKPTKTTKQINFRVDIPDYIYNKAMEITDISERPKTRYIESSSFEFLHTELKNISNKVHSFVSLEKESEMYVKKLVIKFDSKETGERDRFNHAYMGQRISTNFQYYLVYEFENKNSIMGGKKYFCFKTLETQKNLVDSENNKRKYHFLDKPEGIIIDWTEERENFLKELESKFRNLSEGLNLFLSDIDSEKMDKLIENKSLRKLLA
jgi:hypothetical protein